MAITLVDSNQTFETNFWSGNALTLVAPTGLADNDVLVAWIVDRHGSAVISPPAGWTEIDLVDEGALQTGVWYKVASSESGNYDFTASLPGSSSGIDAFGVISAFRGVDTGSPLDVTYVNANHHVYNAADKTPDPVGLTTATDGALVICAALTRTGSGATGTLTDPSGYTSVESLAPAATSVAGGVAYKEVASFGPETPGAWTYSGGSGGDYDTGMYTIALKPGAGGGGTGVTRTIAGPGGIAGQGGIAGKRGGIAG